jgi:RecJ-like exonuclease
MTTATAKTAKMTTCPRCDGKGHIPEYGFIANGVCFRCGGSGEVVYRKPTVNKYAQVNAMHCKTAAEAHAFRLAEIEKRFPGVLQTLPAETVTKLSYGGPIKKLLGH